MNPKIYVKGHGLLSFAEDMGCKYGQRLLDTTKMLAINAPKTALKRVIQKTAEATGDLVGYKTAEKITKVASKSTQKEPKKLMATQTDQTSLQPIEIPKERYIPPERKQQITDELRLVELQIYRGNGVLEDHQFARQH